VVVRYGAPNENFYFGADGATSVPCGPLNADPASGQAKTCSFTTDLSLPTAYSPCAYEGGTCDVGPDPVWVRYGATGAWYESVQSGIVNCNTGSLGVDPASGQAKRCEVGTPLRLNSAGFKLEATGGSAFTLPPSMNPVLLRYGTGGSWVYQLTDARSFTCSNATFNQDPAPGQAKQCEYSVLPGAISLAPKWAKVGSYNQTFTFTEEVGQTYSYSQTDTQEWSNTITVGMETGFDLEGTSTKVSSSVASTYAHSQSFQQDVSNTVLTSVSVQCGGDGLSVPVTLYQFIVSGAASCLGAGTCSGDTRTRDFWCAVNPPPGYAGPQCMPGHCANALCTQCSAD